MNKRLYELTKTENATKATVQRLTKKREKLETRKDSILKEKHLLEKETQAFDKKYGLESIQTLFDISKDVNPDIKDIDKYYEELKNKLTSLKNEQSTLKEEADAICNYHKYIQDRLGEMQEEFKGDWYIGKSLFTENTVNNFMKEHDKLVKNMKNLEKRLQDKADRIDANNLKIKAIYEEIDNAKAKHNKIHDKFKIVQQKFNDGKEIDCLCLNDIADKCNNVLGIEYKIRQIDEDVDKINTELQTILSKLEIAYDKQREAEYLLKEYKNLVNIN